MSDLNNTIEDEGRNDNVNEVGNPNVNPDPNLGVNATDLLPRLPPIAGVTGEGDGPEQPTRGAGATGLPDLDTSKFGSFRHTQDDTTDSEDSDVSKIVRTRSGIPFEVREKNKRYNKLLKAKRRKKLLRDLQASNPSENVSPTSVAQVSVQSPTTTTVTTGHYLNPPRTMT